MNSNIVGKSRIEMEYPYSNHHGKGLRAKIRSVGELDLSLSLAYSGTITVSNQQSALRSV